MNVLQEKNVCEYTREWSVGGREKMELANSPVRHGRRTKTRRKQRSVYVRRLFSFLIRERERTSKVLGC